MRQKLALARALLHEPPVLLLDEPTSAMDPESARLVRDSIRELRSSERTIVVCTHNLTEAEELADQIAIIRRGRLIAKGTALELKQRFLGPAEYEVRLGGALNGFAPPELPGIEFTGRGHDWLRFKSADPALANPRLLRALLERELPVVSLQEAERSLEQVYSARHSSRSRRAGPAGESRQCGFPCLTAGDGKGYTGMLDNLRPA